jgi:hypothetical protein
MENLIGKWGGIPIKGIKNGEYQNYIHPEDIYIMNNIQQPVVEIIGKNSGYLIIKSDNYICRIDPTIIQECKRPIFFINDKVKFLNSKDFIEFGIIKDLYWHNKDRKYVYNIEVNGKMKGRRYYDEDLEKVE